MHNYNAQKLFRKSPSVIINLPFSILPTDLFGASTSFTEFKLDFTPQQAPHQPTNKVSLLEFD